MYIVLLIKRKWLDLKSTGNESLRKVDLEFLISLHQDHVRFCIISINVGETS